MPTRVESNAAFASLNEMAQVQSLDNRGEELYAEAAAIVANTPHTGMQAAAMVNGSQGPAGRFYDKDRAYQGDLQKMRVIGAGPAPVAARTLIDVESFLYGAVVASITSCNRADAAANLRVARSILDETQREIHGRVNPGYSPPEIDPSGHSLCEN